MCGSGALSSFPGQYMHQSRGFLYIHCVMAKQNDVLLQFQLVTFTVDYVLFRYIND